jgi:glutamate/tyrosine decarboxylase-like PLP-dependent enzyme
VLDPLDWNAFRDDAHRALDAAFDALETVRDRPVWQPVPGDVRARFDEPMPAAGRALAEVIAEYRRCIAPYPTGNQHPRFFGWVHGSATPSGALADALAGLLDANVGGRDHAAVYVERQVVRWFAELFGQPADAGGLCTLGTSSANLLAVVAARGRDGAKDGMVGYASAAAHGSVRKAFETAGLGAAALRTIPVDADHRVDPGALASAIACDRADGLRPFVVVGCAGTVGIGATDPLDTLASIAAREGLWFHVDGAFGALAALAPSLRERLRGIERADSIAFDFHKWLRVPYDAGCLIARDPVRLSDAFAAGDAYLARAERGPAGGAPWFADLGIDLSRGFRALKVWFALQEHGADALGASIERNVALAQRLRDLVDADPMLERLAPVPLNIVCFRYKAPGLDAAALDAFTDELAILIAESGRAVVSTLPLPRGRALRVCITNHRTEEADLDELLAAVHACANA